MTMAKFCPPFIFAELRSFDRDKVDKAVRGGRARAALSKVAGR